MDKCYYCEAKKSEGNRLRELGTKTVCGDCILSGFDSGDIGECRHCGTPFIFFESGRMVLDKNDKTIPLCDQCITETHVLKKCKSCGLLDLKTKTDLCSRCASPEFPQGKIIKSNRTFGFELELAFDEEESYIITQELANSYGFSLVHDGSIRARYSGEVVSSVLSGASGEKDFSDFMKELNDIDGVSVNDSCGLHVHLGAYDFLNPPNKKIIVDFPNFDVNKLFTGDESSVDIDLIDEAVINKLGLSDNHLAQFSDTLRSIPYERGVMNIRGHKISVNPHASIEGYACNYYFRKTSKDIETVAEFKKKHLKEYKYGFPSDNDILFLTKKDSLTKAKIVINASYEKGFKNLQTLLFFYTIFNDVILAMLPDDRRKRNAFCQKLSSGFSPYDISSCESMEDMEALWYKSDDRNRIASYKRERYDNSRYYGFNIHPLFSSKKTVEFRWHAATLDTQRILLWASLHQNILDKIKRGYIELPDLISVEGNMFTLEEKVDYFLKTVSLPDYLEEYVVNRLEKFSRINLK